MAIAASLLLASVWLVGWTARIGLDDEEPKVDAAVAEQAAELRDTSFAPEDRYALHVDRAVAPAGQAPVLEELVRRGALPALVDRLPRRPVVLRGVDGIGKYGGTWLRLAIGPDDVSIVTWRMAGVTMVRWSPLGYPIENHLAESLEASDDSRVWTLKLREGMRWSDGQPYDADDLWYWWTCDVNHPLTASNPPVWMRSRATFGRMERVDRWTVRFEFDEPYPLFREVLASVTALADTPEHYLRPFHPDPEIGDVDLVAETMRKYKLPSPGSVYGFMKNYRNPEHPRMWPWVYRRYRSNPPETFVRNAYYPVVDEVGNQLPYIDRLQFNVLDARMLALSAANGGVSMQGRHLRFSDYTELMTRREIAGTRVLHWYPAVRSAYVVNPNLNRRVDPQLPETRWKAELLSDKRFRQALSLAVDRSAIVQAEQVGIGEPSQVSPGPQSDFPAPQLSQAYIAYRPDSANALLDELGLTQRDREGMRTFRDGTRMTFFLDFTAYSGAGPAEFIVDNWGAVGIRVVPRERARPLFYVEKNAADFDFNVWTGESDMMPLLSPRYLIPVNTESFYAVNWARWFQFGGYYGSEQARGARGATPIPRDHPMYAAVSAWVSARSAIDLQEQRRYLQQVYDIAAENVWSISFMTPPPVPIVTDAALRNVPPVALWGAEFNTPSNAGMESYFFADAAQRDTPAVRVDVQEALLKTVPRPAADGSDGRGTGATSVIVTLFWIALGLLLALLAWKHPFVWRRLLVMVPMLLIVSVITFVIIQLPPGDFLSSRIMLLQESGDEANLRQIEDLREVFRFDDPAWRQYLRWMGVDWFLTFDATDTGLLQGNLGRSMETLTPINQLVGDRLLLTTAISLGTIALTWMIALPVGIYSAVRQYSKVDYTLTLICFLGMCTPAFLLALVLMAISGVSGLFSPEYAAQPNWSVGKVIDLLKHIWIPIVVLGVTGTAGMIRIMRANLLDELRKPYVVTARAKGVRPTKLLLKYPVRLALNPFVSGIGHLFPQIVSGGAIVAMVLALPTVGPLLLSALFTEDMYLAGSMLMVLSLLGFVGTLVSDLLLLWLDPRIRYEGTSR